MNLYNLHSKPESLNFYEKVFETNPEFFWSKYKKNKKELKKKEKYIVKSAQYSYYYALTILESQFPAGEEAISKDTRNAYLYAKYILNGPFPAGEEVIAKNISLANQYAENVLKKDFYFNGKLIAKYEP